MMASKDEAKAALILLAQLHYQNAKWWQLAAAWICGRHQTVRHLGRIARISFWRDQPYLLSFRETL